jgi:hypothetical protein
VRIRTSSSRTGNTPAAPWHLMSMAIVRTWSVCLTAFLAIGLAGCARDDDHKDSAAREAGKAAYKIAQESKEALKKADRKLREAGHEAREGWKDAKRDAHAKDAQANKDQK